MRTLLLVAVALSLPFPARAEADDALAADELAAAPQDEARAAGSPQLVVCPDGARNAAGRCLEENSAAHGGAGAAPAGGRRRRGGGAAEGDAAAALALLFALAAMARSRSKDLGAIEIDAQQGVGGRARVGLSRGVRGRLALGLTLAAACGDAPSLQGFDDAEAPVAAAGGYLDVSAAEGLDGRGAALALAHQEVDAARFAEPSAQFSLSRHAFEGAIPLRRRAAGCGDRLTAGAGEELFGYAASAPDEGTAPLVELEGPGGCAALATDAETIASLEAEGYRRGAVLGHVWPPGWGDAPPAEDAAAAPSGLEAAAPAPCRPNPRPALFLFYAGFGAPLNPRLLAGCPGEVVIGEKNHDGPHGTFRTAAAHAAGGRTAYVYANFGNELLDLLRARGPHAAAENVRARLASGYDYVVIDEITADPRWADSSLESKAFRQMLLELPPRKVIGYVSLDLTRAPGGFEAMKARRWLLRALRLRGRALALEVYLKSSEVVRGAAPAAFRLAADRLALALHGMPGAAGISTRAITVIGLTAHSKYPQYVYLDDPRADLASIHRQATALRHSGSRLRAQHGLGFYFAGVYELEPTPPAYTLDGLAERVHAETLRFR